MLILKSAAIKFFGNLGDINLSTLKFRVVNIVANNGRKIEMNYYRYNSSYKHFIAFIKTLIKMTSMRKIGIQKDALEALNSSISHEDNFKLKVMPNIKTVLSRRRA